MVLSTLSFNGFSLRFNPIKLEIKNSFRKHKYTVPDRRTCVESLERNPVVYTGVGEMFGEDCLEQYRELEKLFFRGRKGVLCIPDMPAVYAWFTSLEFLGDTRKDLITYKFEFTQADTTAQENTPAFHICRSGETLFDIAYEYGKRVEDLVEFNPTIKRPDELSVGEKVKLC